MHETEIRIAPEISARLASLPVKPLQPVRKGEVIAKLSSPEIAASLEEAKANAESARANLANVEAGVRQEERDTAAQNVAIADSNVTLAKEQFARVSTLAAKNYASKQQFDEDAAALSEAQASLVLAKAALAQSQAGPTKEELAVAQSEVALALATVADLEAQIAKTTLTSPVDGIARLLVAEPGRSDFSGPACPDARCRRRPLVHLHDPRGPSPRRHDRFKNRRCGPPPATASKPGSPSSGRSENSRSGERRAPSATTTSTAFFCAPIRSARRRSSSRA